MRGQCGPSSRVWQRHCCLAGRQAGGRAGRRFGWICCRYGTDLQHDHPAWVLLALRLARVSHAKEEGGPRRHVGALRLQRRHQRAGGGESAAHGHPSHLVCTGGRGQGTGWHNMAWHGLAATQCASAAAGRWHHFTVSGCQWLALHWRQHVCSSSVLPPPPPHPPDLVARPMVFCSCCTRVTRPTGDRSTFADTWATWKRCRAGQGGAGEERREGGREGRGRCSDVMCV